MLKVESKVGKIPKKDEKVYNFLTDFNNFKNFIPDNQIKNWESTTDTCKFDLDPIGKIGFKIIEKEPYKLIKVVGFESKIDFTLWIQLKHAHENDTKIKITLHANLNPFMAAFAKKPLQNFVDLLIEKMGSFNYQ